MRVRDYTAVQDKLDELEWSQESLAHRADVNLRTISRAFSGVAISDASVEAIAKAVGLTLADVPPRQGEDPKVDAETGEIGRQLLCIGSGVLREFYRVAGRRDLAAIPLAPENIDPEARPTWLDQHLAEEGQRLLAEGACQPDSPTHSGYALTEEELGIKHERGYDPKRSWQFRFDVVDNSEMADVGLGGQGVLSAALPGKGLQAIVMVDYVRKRLFSCRKGEPTTIIGVTDLQKTWHPARPEDVPEGRPIPTRVRPTTELKGCRLNAYFGKHYRVRDAHRYLGSILSDEYAVTLYPYGGAFGPALVAEGTLDVSVESCKGMRHLDGLPALMLANNAGAVCLDPDTGKRFAFGPDPRLDVAIAEGDVQAFRTIRRKFVCAATMQLARTVVKELPRADT